MYTKKFLELAIKFPNNLFLLHTVERLLYKYHILFIEVGVDCGGTFFYSIIKAGKDYLGKVLAMNDWPCGQFNSPDEAKIDAFKKILNKELYKS